MFSRAAAALFFRIFELACGVLPEGGVNGGVSPLGYTFEASEFYAPRLVTALQRKGIRVEVSPTGLLVVPVAGQPLDGPALHEVISALAAECAVDVTALPGGRRKTLDTYVKDRSLVRQPRTAIITDTGASSQQGSLWHLLDEHYAMNHSLVDLGTFAGRNFDIGRYDVLVFSGNVALDKVDAAAWKKLAGWVEAGGTLMLCGEAHKVSGIIGDDSISPENLALFAGAPLVAGKHQGSGYILYIQEDFAYRAYWLGTNAILANALLFGDKL